MNSDLMNLQMITNFPINSLEIEITSQIILAIYDNDYDRLLDILKQDNNQSVDMKILSFTPLHFAAEFDDHQAAEILICYGADPNARYNKQSLDFKIFYNQLSLELDQVVAIDAKQINSPDFDELTPLQIATIYDNYEVILVLLRAGADIDQISKESKSKILWQALHSDMEKLFELVLPHVENLNEPNELGISLVHLAVANNRHHMLQLLLERDADPNIKGPDGRTPIHWSGQGGNLIGINILLSYGVNINKVDDYGNTIIHLMISSRFFHYSTYLNSENNHINLGDITKFLLQSGLDPKICDNKGRTILEYVEFGENRLEYYEKYSGNKGFYRDLIEWLIIYGAEWNRQLNNLLKDKKTKLRRIIVEYYLKKKLAGLKYRTDAFININDLFLDEFSKQCIVELKKMKTRFLYGNITMYRFLRSSSNKRSLVFAWKQDEVKKICEQGLYKTEYPIYQNLIEYNFMEGEKYESVYDSAYDNLNSLCQYRLTNLVLDKIMNYIDKKDMDNLNKAQEYIINER